MTSVIGASGSVLGLAIAAGVVAYICVQYHRYVHVLCCRERLRLISVNVVLLVARSRITHNTNVVCYNLCIQGLLHLRDCPVGE